MESMGVDDINTTITYAGNMSNLHPRDETAHTPITAEQESINKTLAELTTAARNIKSDAELEAEAESRAILRMEEIPLLFDTIGVPARRKPPGSQPGTSNAAGAPQNADEDDDDETSEENDDHDEDDDEELSAANIELDRAGPNNESDSINEDIPEPVDNEDEGPQNNDGDNPIYDQEAGPYNANVVADDNSVDSNDTGIVELDDLQFDMREIANLFVIDYPGVVGGPQAPANDPAAPQPRFTFRCQDDVKAFLRHILDMYNMQEHNLMFDVEVFSLLMCACMTGGADKIHVLKLVKAFLYNNMTEVFRIVDFRDGWEHMQDIQVYMDDDDDSGAEDAYNLVNEPMED